MSLFSELLQHLGEHLLLTGTAVAVSCLVAWSLVWLTWNRPTLRHMVVTFCNLIQTIPSLALLAFLIPLLGLGYPPALTALVLYALLPLLRNTYTALAQTPVELVEAGRNLGLNEIQLWWHVHLPQGLPLIVAGLRTATVWSVGTATLSAYIGAGGLGDFITRGITFMDNRLLLLGAIPAALMALTLDTALGWVETQAQHWKDGS